MMKGELKRRPFLCVDATGDRDDVGDDECDCTGQLLRSIKATAVGDCAMGTTRRPGEMDGRGVGADGRDYDDDGCCDDDDDVI